MHSLWVNKTDLANAKWQHSDTPQLHDGQILLAVEKYALTANNITYAVVGDSFGYWNFFPTGDAAWGIVPVWGFARVEASQHPDIAVGERVYGYLPMASHLLVTPGHVSAAGFVDSADHRKGLAIIYNQYNRLGTQTGKGEEERALFQPLFTTSFLIEDVMHQAGWHAAQALVLTSASSKTALALALVTRNLSPQIKRIGLTSPANIAFVRQTGLYDEVLTYDQLGSADATQPVVSVDFAGNGTLLAAIHAHWQSNLKFSSLVGATHIEERKGARDLQGPAPVMFFAPSAAQALLQTIGPAEFQSRVTAQFNAFLTAVADHLGVEHLSGEQALKSAWLEMLANRVAPDRGLICHIG
jgi:voltage-gated potassium channel Kch